MSGVSQPDYRETALSEDLLSTPFRTRTKWCVITGASCSGKTTLIEMLAAKGFRTVPEAGRKYFERELSKGRPIEEIRAHPAAFTPQIYEFMLAHERGLPASEIAFLDRALPDGFAFYRIAGLDPNQILPDCFQNRYACVFLLKRLPYLRDGVRVADDETAAYLESWIKRDYRALGYKVIQVPVLSPEDRLAFVLKQLSELGLVS